MADDNEEVLTDKDRELFLDIAKDIRNNPGRYREAGKWLDEYCSEEAYWQRQENTLKELQSQKKSFPSLPIVQEVNQLEQKIETKRTPALLIRFHEARDNLLGKYEDQQFIPEDNARRIILIVWLLTDPDVEKANANITELEKWSWEPINDVTKMSRGYAQFLFFHGGRVYNPWMKLVRIAWAKLSAENGCEASSGPIQDKKSTFAKSLLDNLLRASIKHLPFCGSFLHDVIYGTIDSQKSQKATKGKQGPLQSDVVLEKHHGATKRKLSSQKPSKSISLKIAEITLITAIITLLGALLTSPLWESFTRSRNGDSEGTKASPPDNKLLGSLREICQDIDDRPLLQKKQTAQSYVGMYIDREPLNLDHISIEDQAFRILAVFPGKKYRPFTGGWGVTFEVDKDEHPELVGAKEGLHLCVSGQIEDAGESYVQLSDASLSFD